MDRILKNMRQPTQRTELSKTNTLMVISEPSEYKFWGSNWTIQKLFAQESKPILQLYTFWSPLNLALLERTSFLNTATFQFKETDHSFTHDRPLSRPTNFIPSYFILLLPPFLSLLIFKKFFGHCPSSIPTVST